MIKVFFFDKKCFNPSSIRHWVVEDRKAKWKFWKTRRLSDCAELKVQRLLADSLPQS